MAINAKFTSCLAQFLALKATYSFLDGISIKEDVQLTVIMENAVKSPFGDLLDSGIDLKDESLAALGDLSNFDSLKNPLDTVIRLFLRPLDNIVNILGASVPFELKEKIENFINREGFTISLIDPAKYTAIAFSSAIQGVATIKHQKFVLEKLDDYVTKVINSIRDMPDITPPVHPFNETLLHLGDAKANLTSVRSQVLTKNSIDRTRWDAGNKDLKEALTSLSNGRIGETLANTVINQAGLGGFVEVSTETGQFKFINKQELKAINFLPPFELGLHIGVIKKLINQIGSYNSALNNTQDLIQYMINNLYFSTDIARLMGSLLQFVILEISDTEKLLDGASTNSPVGRSFSIKDKTSRWKSPTGTIEAQAQAYGTIAYTKILSEAISKWSKRLDDTDVNNSISSLKSFRKKLDNMDTSGCYNQYPILAQNVAAFISSYNRRMAQRVSSSVVKASGERVKRSIKDQFDYLNCFEDKLNSLGLDNIPTNLLNAMSSIGSALSLIQGFDINNLLDLFNNWDPRAVVVSQMNEKLSCMKKACSNPGVQGVLDKLHNEFQTLDRSFRTNANLNYNFSLQAKFQRKFRGNRISDAIKQFIEAVNNLTC